MEFLTLFLSLRCTHACRHCLYGCAADHGEHMALEGVDRYVSIAREAGIRTLNFFGGEPLLNPDFFGMLETALRDDFSIILATNLLPLANQRIFTRFDAIAGPHRERITIVTANDRFHRRFFDPAETIQRLLDFGYLVRVNDYAERSVAITEYNSGHPELAGLNHAFTCCGGKWTDYMGVPPDGGWTICPASIEGFGDVAAQDLAEMTRFKRSLPLRYQGGCTECLKDFREFHRRFDTRDAGLPERPD